MKVKIKDYEINVDIDEIAELYVKKYLVSKTESAEIINAKIYGFVDCMLEFGDDNLIQSVVEYVENELWEKYGNDIQDEIENQAELKREEEYMRTHTL